jgi:hypothetical protein
MNLDFNFILNIALGVGLGLIIIVIVVGLLIGAFISIDSDRRDREKENRTWKDVLNDFFNK